MLSFSGADLDVCNKDNFTALLIAARNGHEEALKVLLENGADIAIADKTGKTAIHWAAEVDNVEALKVCGI